MNADEAKKKTAQARNRIDKRARTNNFKREAAKQKVVAAKVTKMIPKIRKGIAAATRKGNGFFQLAATQDETTRIGAILGPDGYKVTFKEGRPEWFDQVEISW